MHVHTIKISDCLNNICPTVEQFCNISWKLRSTILMMAKKEKEKESKIQQDHLCMMHQFKIQIRLNRVTQDNSKEAITRDTLVLPATPFPFTKKLQKANKQVTF